MTGDRKFSCFLIGRESFLTPCAKHLLDCGHQILGIVVTDIAATDLHKKKLDCWTDFHRIPQLQDSEDLFIFLSQQPFDYLFSISNSKILSPEILALPRQFAINCHDALLPQYGGINAPSWAIFNREPIHGITWHQIATLVDGGSILKQVRFEIEANETAATLNSKCYEQIIGSFTELIEEIESEKISAIAQNLEERSYFLSSQKPSPGCILNWQDCARNIDAMVRSLSFDCYENSLGLPKIAIVSNLAIVSQIEVMTEKSLLPPGTIVSLSADLLQISTSSNDIAICKVTTLDGEPLDLSKLVKTGMLISTQIEPTLARQIEKIETNIAKHERFWVKRLATLNPLIISDLGMNKGNSKFHYEKVTISPAIGNFLASRKSKWTFSNFLTAAIVTYLSRISHQNCFDLAVKFANVDRQLGEIPELFADRVPCRFDLDLDCSFEIAVEEIVRELDFAADRQTYARDVVLRYPELQVLSKLKVADRLPISIERTVSIEDYLDRQRLERDDRQHELIFIIAEQGEDLYFHSNSDSFDLDCLQRLIERLTVFIDGIIDNPAASVTSLPLLSVAETDRLLVEWNDTQVNFEAEYCIHQLIETQVLRTPDLLAVVDATEEITYQELNRRANRLAAYLRTLGVGADVLVGICVDRSIHAIVAMLGILKAGGAYVPLDLAYPSERIALIIEDAALSIIVTHSQLVGKLSSHTTRLVCIDVERADFQTWQCEHNPLSAVEPHHLAYVIYTSGSTGKPKGVEIEHRSLVNYTIAARREFQITQQDRVLQFTSINFDVSAEEIYPCLTIGATLVVRDNDTVESIDTFLFQCRSWNITIASLPTAFWHELVAGLDADYLIPPLWRLAIIGGEPAAPDKLLRWHKIVGRQIRLINAYGPTEVTISALMCDLSTFDPQTSLQRVSIGRPIANTQVYVLDNNLALCPIGVPGELYIGGAGLARGYLNNPELTASRFIPNPFHPTLSARLYQTGDRVKYLPDGTLQFLDRLDNQVKIRGFRIEIGEIETILNQHPDIQTAIVVDRAIGSRLGLAAYIVFNHQLQIVNGELYTSDSIDVNAQSRLSTKQIRADLAKHLPDYMVPAAIFRIETLPLTPNGKIDRQALRSLNLTKIVAPSDRAIPTNPIEEILSDIWSEILELPQIDIHDNFFELGGHSLLAIQLFRKIESKLNIQVPFAMLVKSPTIARLAEQITISAHTHISSSLIPIQPKGSQPPFFCVHSLDPCLLFYQSLVKNLGLDQPFYAIQPYDIDNQLLCFARIEEMAVYYLTEVRTIQPNGPYYLGGFSHGGYVAFEMARQLKQQGELVALLAIFDTEAPDFISQSSISTQSSQFLKLLLKYRQRFLYEKLAYRLELSRRMFISISQKIYSYWQKTQGESISLDRSQWQQAFEINNQAFENYHPNPYPGKITLFRASYSLGSIDPTMGWDKLAGMGLETIDIPGNHASIFEKTNAIVLARELNACIQKTVAEN